MWPTCGQTKMPPKKRQFSSSRQLTLFDSFDSEKDSERSEAKKKRVDPQESTENHEANGLAAMTGTENVAEQQNYITLDKPIGSTTIVINKVVDVQSNKYESSDESDSEAESEPDDDPDDATEVEVPVTVSHGAESQKDSLPSDIAQSVVQSPVQPNVKFPFTKFGSSKRRFRLNWYRKYKWIEYSVDRNAAFCYPCRLFPAAYGRTEESFTKTGFCDWKHATGKKGILVCHDTCYSHKKAMLSWSDFKVNAKKGTSIDNLLASDRRRQIEQNRHYLQTLTEVILVCAKQDIPLRGHRESQTSESPWLNRGNFIEILHLVGKHDHIVQEKLETCPRNAKYTSPEIQNTLLEIMGNMVRKTICDNIREAGVFSLMADETKDCSKKEQMSVVLRYVSLREAVIHEHF